MTSITGLYSTDDITINGLPTFQFPTFPTDGSFNTLYATDISCNTLNASNRIQTNELLQVANNTFLLVSNYAFDTPVRTINTGAVVAFPYTAITSWSLSNISGTTPTISTGRGFWDTLGPNCLVTEYPGYPAVTQSLCVQQNAINTFRIQQSISATAGNYLVTFFIWGRFNGYRTSQTVSCTFGTVTSSSNTAVEQSWKKIQFATQVDTTGPTPIIFNFIQTTAITSGMVITNISIQKLGGIVSRNTTSMATGSCLRPDLGLYCYGSIYNTGPLDNYGAVNIYGQLNPVVARVKNSMVIGNCKWGSSLGNTNDTGQFTQLIGDGIAANISSSLSGNFTNIVALGSAAMEQLNGTRLDMIGIGYRAARYAGSQTSIAIGTGTMQNLGFAGTSSSNIAIGHLSMGQMGSNNNNNNCCVGNSTLFINDFANSRSFNCVFGNSSGTNVSSNSNTIIGYNSCANMINTTSILNSFLGAQCGNNQSGSGNIMAKCTFLGANSDVNTAATYNNSTAVGFNAKITNSNQIVMGGDDGTGVFPNVHLPNKNTLRAVHSVGAVASFSITFGMSENIDINSTTTTTINLPTPAAANIGTRFHLYKRYTAATVITIVAPASQTILADKETVGLYAFGTNQNYLTLVCTGNSTAIDAFNWVAEGNAKDLQGDFDANITGVFDFLTNPIFNVNGIPNDRVAGFDNLAYQVSLNTNNISSIQSNVSTIQGTLTNVTYNSGTDTTRIASSSTQVDSIASISLGGTIDMTNNVNFWDDVYLNNNVWKLNGYSELSGSPNNLSFPLSRVYILTTTSNGAVTLPGISADMYGIEITFIKTSAANAYTINTNGTDTFRRMGSNSSATATSITLDGRNTILKVIATQATVWAVVVDNIEGTEAPLITATSSIFLPYFNSYSIATATTSTITITLPAASILTEGLRFTFRRTNTVMSAVNSASLNIRPIDNTTMQNAILSTTQYICEIGVFKTGATTYEWFLLRTA